jgi:hypothetical protein
VPQIEATANEVVNGEGTLRGGWYRRNLRVSSWSEMSDWDICDWTYKEFVANDQWHTEVQYLNKYSYLVDISIYLGFIVLIAPQWFHL